MSFVLCVCNDNYSIMVGDSRLVTFNQEKDIQTVDENFKKVLQINENVSIGFTGDPKAMLTILEELMSCHPKILTLGQVRKIVVDKIKLLETNELGVKIIISGRNRYGNMLMYVLDKKSEYKIEKYEPQKTCPSFSCAGSNYLSIKPILDKYIFKTYPWNNIEQLESYMVKCVQEVSKIDDSVNDNIQSVVIT